MIKKLLIIFFIFSRPLFAGNNLTITCNSDSCEKLSELPLFDEVNLAPGFSQTQTLKIINQRSDNCNLFFKFNSDSNHSILSSVQTLSVTADNYVWYSGSLSDLFDNKNHQLGQIDSNQCKNYLWTISLNQSAGNEYQLLNNSFDIDFNFTCGENNSPSDSLCHDTPPTNSPQNLKAISNKNSVTLFWDEPDDFFTYYLIAYSDNENAATFANPNIGGQGTNSYIINNLSADTTYYFKIRTGNGCAAGPFSNIVSATPLPVLSFQSDILGVEITIPINNIENPKLYHIFPYAFLLALIINLILSRYRLFIFIISLLSFAFDYYLSQFTNHKYPYFYLANILSFLIPLFLSFKKNPKRLQ